MAHFAPKLEKTADDESKIVLCIDGHHAWFVERPDDRKSGANPIGAFRSQEAAKKWADREFEGGEWKPV